MVGKSFDLKTVFNKANKQITLTLPKKKLPKDIQLKIKENPSSLKGIKVNIEKFY